MKCLESLANEYEFSWVTSSISLFERHTLPPKIRDIQGRDDLLRRGSMPFDIEELSNSFHSDDRMPKLMANKSGVSEPKRDEKTSDHPKFFSQFGGGDIKRAQSQYTRKNSKTFSTVSKLKKVKTYGKGLPKITPNSENKLEENDAIWIDVVTYPERKLVNITEAKFDPPLLTKLESKPSESKEKGSVITNKHSAISKSSEMMSDKKFEHYDIYVFLNRTLIKALRKDNLRLEPETVVELVRLDFSLLTEEMNRSTSFFSVWLDLCLEKTIADFNNVDAKTDKALVKSLENMFNSIKLFSSIISKAFHLILNRTEAEEAIISCPEEKYLIPIFDVIFNKKTFRKESIRRSMLASSIKVGKFALKEMYYNALLKDNSVLIKSFEEKLPTFKPELHPLLALNVESIILVSEIIDKKEEEEFIISAKRINPFIPLNLTDIKVNRTPYDKAITQLEEIRQKDSPFEKAVHILNTVKYISDEITHFYRDNNIDIQLSLTSEEIFPIMMYIMKYICNSKILIDLYICYSFLPADIKSSDAGYYTHLLLTAYHFMCNDI